MHTLVPSTINPACTFLLESVSLSHHQKYEIFQDMLHWPTLQGYASAIMNHPVAAARSGRPAAGPPLRESAALALPGRMLSTNCRSNSHGARVIRRQALRDRLHVARMAKPAQKPAALHKISHSTRIQKAQAIFRLAKLESLGQGDDLH